MPNHDANDYKAEDGYNIKPFISTLHLINEVNKICEVLFLAKKLGFKLNKIITWYKVNAMPNITKRTYTHSTEFVGL